jgi:hypothetical protein
MGTFVSKALLMVCMYPSYTFYSCDDIIFHKGMLNVLGWFDVDSDIDIMKQTSTMQVSCSYLLCSC